MSHQQVVVRAIGWNAIGIGVRFVVQFGTSVLLARLLGPTAFGVIAAAMLVIALGALLSEGGLGAGLIAQERIDAEEIARVQTMQLLVAVGIVVALWFARWPIARAMNMPTLASVLPVLALQFPLQVIGSGGNALLKRDMNFRATQTAQTLAYLVGYGGVGLGTALAGYGVWSLVLAQLVFVACHSALLLVLSRLRLTFGTRLPSRAIIVDGARVAASNIGAWVNSAIGTAAVGSSFGPRSLGLYDRASTLVGNPASLMISLFESALFPAFAQARLRGASTAGPFLATYGAALVVSVPMAAFVALHASPILLLLFGGEWAPAAPLLSILAFLVVPRAVAGITSALLWGYQKAHEELLGQAIALGLVIALFALGAAATPAGVALAVVLGGVARAGLVTCAAARTLHISGRRFAHVLGRAAFAGLLVWGSTLMANLVRGTRPTNGTWGIVVSDAAIAAVCIAAVLISAPRALIAAELWSAVRRAAAGVPVFQRYRLW